jgi:uncharacterized repeat protein (TIGR01451 family)
MPSKRRLARQGSAVVLSSFLVATSLRVAADKPSGERLAKAFRDRKPRQLLELLRGGSEAFQNAREGFLAEHGGVPPWRRGRQGDAPDWANRLNRRFHAGGLSEIDPEPVNPLLDPLGLFEDEAGEQPPIGQLPRLFLADFDGDGDLDVFAGDKYGYVRYLENVGSATDPVYEERTGAASPTGAIDLSCDDEDPMETSPCGPSAPALADLDGDDDLDLFVGQGYYDGPGTGGRVLYFENDGSGNLARNDAANPFDGFVFGFGYATPTFVDIDGDDDLDAFVGTKFETPGPYGGEVYFLRNDGDDENPLFSDQSDTAEDPFAGEGFFPFTAPYFADVDGDDDLDAFVGAGYKTRYFRNDTVVPGTPVFPERTGYDHPLGGGLMLAPGPVLADVDGDGDLDAFVGMGKDSDYEVGYVQFFENTGTPTDPGFLAPGDRLELVDVDGDGDLDALVSHVNASYYSPVPERGTKATGTSSPPLAVWYFENVGTEAEPSWQLRTGLDNPFCTFNEGYVPSGSPYFFPSLAPTVGDLDGDGLLDAFVGLPDGTLEFLEDDGTGQLDPAATHPLEAIDFGDSADPQLVDVNGDGELDLVVGYDYYDGVTEDYYARVAFFLNPTGPDGLEAPPDLVLDFEDTLYRPAPVVADLDGDGDLDLLVGGYSYDYLSQTLFLENTGTPGAPAFDVSSAQQVEVLVAPMNSPAVGDVNGDGFPDVFLGNLAGTEFFVTEAAMLEVTKEVTGGDLQPGGTVEYTVTITNVGTAPQPDDPANPELVDTLPPELVLESAMVVSGPGTVTTAGNTVTYDGAIGVGESVSIVIAATLDGGIPGNTIDNQAIASFDLDGDGTNDTDEPSDDPETADVDDPTTFEIGLAPNLDPAEIPTLSQWGSMLFAGLLSLLGLLGLRRMGG